MSPEFPVQMPCLFFRPLLGSECRSSQDWQKEHSQVCPGPGQGSHGPIPPFPWPCTQTSDFSGQPGWLTSDHISILETYFEGLRLAAAHLPVLVPASGTGLNFLMNDSLHHHPSCPRPICVLEPPPLHKLSPNCTLSAQSTFHLELSVGASPTSTTALLHCNLDTGTPWCLVSMSLL